MYICHGRKAAVCNMKKQIAAVASVPLMLGKLTSTKICWSFSAPFKRQNTALLTQKLLQWHERKRNRSPTAIPEV
jgi:hypothetical protein